MSPSLILKLEIETTEGGGNMPEAISDWAWEKVVIPQRKNINSQAFFNASVFLELLS